jgi:cytochrome c peroxidase
MNLNRAPVATSVRELLPKNAGPSVGAEGQVGRRNAMPLANLAWARELFWDGRAKSIREQVLLPIQDAHEMNESLERVVAKLSATPGYPEQFRRAFGEEGITSQKVALALEQFLLTLVSQESRFDPRGARSHDLERAGAARPAIIRYGETIPGAVCAGRIVFIVTGATSSATNSS